MLRIQQEQAHPSSAQAAISCGRRIPRKYARAKPFSEEELDRKRITANIQERQRMQRLNNALDMLKATLPTHLHSRRLSKIKTLKMAIGYIQFLTQILQTDQSNVTSSNI